MIKGEVAQGGNVGTGIVITVTCDPFCQRIAPVVEHENKSEESAHSMLPVGMTAYDMAGLSMTASVEAVGWNARAMYRAFLITETLPMPVRAPSPQETMWSSSVSDMNTGGKRKELVPYIMRSRKSSP